jgi:hypothetical protein
MIFLRLFFYAFHCKRLGVHDNTLSCIPEVDMWHQFPTCKVCRQCELMSFPTNVTKGRINDEEVHQSRPLDCLTEELKFFKYPIHIINVINNGGHSNYFG